MNEINPIDLGIACIVLIGYISGKLWMYYRIEDTPTKKPKRIKSRVIKRGNEWPE